MSDLPSNVPDSATQEISAAVSSAKAEINALINDLKSKKAEFDSLADSSAKAISSQIDDAKSGGQEIVSLRNEAVSAKGTMENERNDLITKAKSVQTEIENTRNNIATIKGSLDAMQVAVTTDAANVAQSKADVEKLKAAASSLSEKIASEHLALEQQISELQSTKDALAEILQQLSNLKLAAENDGQAAKSYLEELTKTRDTFANLNSESGTQYEALVSRQNSLSEKIAEIEAVHGKISEYGRGLFDTSENALSTKDQIAQLQADISKVLADVSQHRDVATDALNGLAAKATEDSQNFAATQDKKFSDLYTSLQQRILDLLPSAGAAGLASTFYDAKSRYAPTSFAGRLGDRSAQGFWGTLRKWFGYNPASVIATCVFYAMFILPLGFIIVESVLLLYRIENDPHFTLHYEMILVRLLIVLPLATISGFGFASLQLYRRLFEEYNHKQRVMELYQSFSEEIAAAGDDSQKKDLLNIMLASVSQKAWEGGAKTSSGNVDFGVLASLERLTGDLAKLKDIVGH